MMELLARFRVHLLVVLMLALPASNIALSRGKPGRGPVAGVLIQGVGALQAGGRSGLGFVEDFWKDYVDLRDLKQENERLRQQISRYEEERARLIGVLQENARLRQMLKFKDGRPDLKLRPARIIGRDVTPYFRVLRVKIDARSADITLKPQMAVVSTEGVVGQIIEVNDEYADVMLVSDPRSKLDVMTQRSRTRGVIKGLGHRKDYEAQMAFLRRKDEIAEADVIVTSGKGGMFPQELLVGQVSRVDRKAFGLEQQAIVEPTVDPGRLEEVFIITGENTAGYRP